MARPTEDPETRILERLDKIKTLTKEALEAPTKAEFVAKRQRVHTIRYEIDKICRENGLPARTFPPLPANPWTLGTPGPKPNSQAGIPESPAAEAKAPEGPDPLAALKTPEFTERVGNVVISGLMDMAEASQISGIRIERNFQSLGLPTPTAAHVHHCASRLFRKLVDQMVESLHA